MAQQNYYKSNLRDLSFLLFEQFHLEDLPRPRTAP